MVDAETPCVGVEDGRPGAVCTRSPQGRGGVRGGVGVSGRSAEPLRMDSDCVFRDEASGGETGPPSDAPC